MTHPQFISLAVLAAVVCVLIWGRFRSEVVALTGAAVLLVTHTIRPIDVQGAFASPAIITLASLFVISYAMELSGVMGLAVRGATRLCKHLGVAGIWMLIAASGAISAFLNNTPVVVLAAPVVRDVSEELRLSAKRFLIPLSYATILGGACTLIGTATNLIVDNMARNAGQPPFRLFEITPVALVIALAGGAYLFAFSNTLAKTQSQHPSSRLSSRAADAVGDKPDIFPLDRPLQPFGAVASLLVFALVTIAAALNVVPIAAAAFSGAVLLVLLGVISADDAYRGLRPEILLLIAGMVVIGLALQATGLAQAAADAVNGAARAIGPLGSMALLYAATLTLTEFLSNAVVAVLFTPIAIAMADSLHASPRPFLVAVMMAASAAFATPFGYQTNVLVYKIGQYSYTDFARIGVPLNILTWVAGVIAISIFFPF
jgi:di/tricarboxylate transporter